MGTLGGNVLLDTRCLFYNQTEFWRKSLGYCLKAEGTWCHVVGGPKTCVATQSSDTVPVLISLGAKVRLFGPDGNRDLSVADLYKFNGMDHLKVQPGELLTEIRIPYLSANFRGGYQKLRVRGAIDFPQLSVAIAGDWEGLGPSCRVQNLQIVVGAVNPQPKALLGLERWADSHLDDQSIQQIADLAHAKTRPQGSVHGDTAWRRQLTRVFVRRLLTNLRDQEA
jgi:4-hydroxybenzoyl-CoA reductase subunit beta